MIPFFRKVRKKMADDNRPLKYIKYAIGEIFLVVIGILIALQINNWNETRKEKILMQTYIQSIAEDIHADIVSIQRAADALHEQVLAAEHIIPVMESESKIVNDSLAFILDFNAFTTTPIIPEKKNTWDFLNSSGVLSEFPNTELLKMLEDYYRKYNGTVTNFNGSGIPPRLRIRELKYELFPDKEHKKFFPTKTPIAPAKTVYIALFKDERVLPLCRYIGSTAYYFEDRFNSVVMNGTDIIDYINSHYTR